MLSIEDIKAEVERLGAIIDVPASHYLPAYNGWGIDAQPYVEADERGYHLVVWERGSEQERFTTDDLDELLYRIFDGVTFTMAVDYELRHRDEARDCRRITFRKQVELLNRLSPDWAAREAEDHARILSEHGFDDFSSRRVEYFVQLRDRWIPERVAWWMACRRFHLP
jgi:hypothetical protein